MYKAFEIAEFCTDMEMAKKDGELYLIIAGPTESLATYAHPDLSEIEPGKLRNAIFFEGLGTGTLIDELVGKWRVITTYS